MASPQVLAQMSQEELRTFEENKAKAMQGDGQAASIVSAAYLSGKAIPDDKVEALALCLSSIGHAPSLPELFQREDFKKLFGGMSDDLIAKGIKRSFEIKKASENPRKIGHKSLPNETPEPWDVYGLESMLSNIVTSIDAKGRIKACRELAARDPSAESLHALASVTASSAPGASEQDKKAQVESRKIRLQALELTRARPSEASLQSMFELVTAYSQGFEGFPADKEEANKWVELIQLKAESEASEYELQRLINLYTYGGEGFAKDRVQAEKWRVKWVAIMLARAESGGLADWSLLADFLGKNPHYVEQAGGSGWGGSIWRERCLVLQSMKAESGDMFAVDSLLAFFGGSRSGITGSPAGDATSNDFAYLRWLTFALKKFKRPDDALSLSRLYAEGLTYEIDLNLEDRVYSKAQYAEALAAFYLREVAKRAAAGSCEDKFILALIKDDVSADHLYSYGLHSLGGRDILELKKFGLERLASAVPMSWEDRHPFAESALTPIVEATPRSLYLDYLKAFDSQDFSRNGVLFEIKGDTQGERWVSHHPPHFECFNYKKWALSRLVSIDDAVASGYAQSAGSPKDESLALRWRLELVKLGDRTSIAEMAERYDQGKGVAVDRVRAYSYLELAHGDKSSIYPFAESIDVSLKSRFKLSAEDKVKATKIKEEFIKDFRERMIPFAEAAAKGYAAESKRRAKLEVESYRKLAVAGDSGAQANLGVAYRHGYGGVKNPFEASAWLRKAAEQGNAYAQFHLGDLFFSGDGVTKDEVEAYAYWKLSGKTDYDARRKLAGLEKSMPPDALSRGQQRAGELQKEIEAKMAHPKAGK